MMALVAYVSTSLIQAEPALLSAKFKESRLVMVFHEKAYSMPPFPAEIVRARIFPGKPPENTLAGGPKNRPVTRRGRGRGR